MAIYHLSAKTISRSAGRSSTAASAYRAGCEIADNRTGEIFDYSKKKGVEYSQIMLPSTAPERLKDRSILWNEVELSEKRKDAQVAREIEIALPVELHWQEQSDLIRAYVQKHFVDKGMIADFSIHNPHRTDAPPNPHAHIMLTTREITPEGFKNKNRDWNSKELLEEWREGWANMANMALERAGQKEKIDHRSFKRQGLEQEPTIKMGASAIALERRGITTDRGNQNREIKQRNNLLKEWAAELKELKSKIENWVKTAVKKEPEPKKKDERIFVVEYSQKQVMTVKNLDEFYGVIDTWSNKEFKTVYDKGTAKDIINFFGYDNLKEVKESGVLHLISDKAVEAIEKDGLNITLYRSDYIGSGAYDTEVIDKREAYNAAAKGIIGKCLIFKGVDDAIEALKDEKLWQGHEGINCKNALKDTLKQYVSLEDLKPLEKSQEKVKSRDDDFGLGM